MLPEYKIEDEVKGIHGKQQDGLKMQLIAYAKIRAIDGTHVRLHIPVDHPDNKELFRIYGYGFTDFWVRNDRIEHYKFVNPDPSKYI